MTTRAQPTPGLVTDKPPRPRRWIPVSLKMFVILLALLGCVCGWLFWRGYRQLLALRQIEDAGGDFELAPFGPHWLRSLAGNDITRMFDRVESASVTFSGDGDPTLITIATGLRTIERLELNGPAITERGLLHLKWLDRLNSLDLSGTQLDAKGLRHLADLPAVEILNLTDTNIDDAGLKHLALMTSLKKCYLANSRITDSGLKYVKQMTSLEVLYLDGTAISDNGLFDLRTLKRLRWLSLTDTAVTSFAANRLDRELPMHPLRNYVPRVMYSGENDPFNVLGDHDLQSR